MDWNRKEYLVNRISAGVIKVYPGCFVSYISPQDKYLAQEIYDEVYQQCYVNGFFLPDELEVFMYDHALWTDEDANLLDVCQKDLDKLRIGVLHKTLQYKELEKTKIGIQRVKDEIHRLLNKKHSLDYMTCEGFANIEKNKYLLVSSLRNIYGEKMFPDYWDADSDLVNKCMSQFLHQRLNENDYRLLARNEPWRSIWTVGKDGDLFGKPVVEYTEEQKNLTLWSTFYDNIYAHPEKPGEVIINCDDFLDGWLVEQRKKQKDREIDDKLNVGDKTGDIFIPVDSPQGIQEVESRNDAVSAHIKKQRIAQIKKQGKLHDVELKDVNQRLRTEFTQGMRERMKRK